MDFQTAVKTCVKDKYATFSGRASRSEYWWFVLAYAIGAVIVSLTGLWILYLIYMLALIVPAAAVGFRRLQDTGRPGTYIFIPVVLGVIGMFLTPRAPMMEGGEMMHMPAAGHMGLLAIWGIVELIVAVVFIWWLTRPSQPEANQYGPRPG